MLTVEERDLPRHPGFELLFLLEACRHRLRLTAIGKGAYANPVHLGPAGRRGHERGESLRGETTGDGLGFAALLRRGDLDDKAAALKSGSGWRRRHR